MKFSSAVSNQLTQSIKVVVNDFARFEAINYLGTNVGAATNRRRVSQGLCSFFDCFDYLPFSRCGLVDDCSAGLGEGARTDQRACPGAKILGAKVLTHYFPDVGIDVRASDIDEFTISILILENFARGMLE